MEFIIPYLKYLESKNLEFWNIWIYTMSYFEDGIQVYTLDLFLLCVCPLHTLSRSLRHRQCACILYVTHPARPGVELPVHGIFSTIRKLHTFRRGVCNPCQLKHFYKWEKWEFRTEANFFKITQLTRAEVRILTPAVWLHRLQFWYLLNYFLLSYLY